MRKLTAIILALAVLFALSPVMAEDFESMSIQQLLALRSSIEAELLARGDHDSFTVPPGEYLIGIDIPAGQYSISLKDPSSYGASIYTHKNEAEFRKGGYDRTFSLRSAGDAVVGKVTLYEGEILEITHASVVFALYSGIKFN
jgi:hypothetical protein